jgi:hypothetical protein
MMKKSRATHSLTPEVEEALEGSILYMGNLAKQWETASKVAIEVATRFSKLQFQNLDSRAVSHHHQKSSITLITCAEQLRSIKGELEHWKKSGTIPSKEQYAKLAGVIHFLDNEREKGKSGPASKRVWRWDPDYKPFMEAISPLKQLQDFSEIWLDGILRDAKVLGKFMK